MILLVIIFICVPLLLLPKPIILAIMHKRGYHEIGASHEPGEVEEVRVPTSDTTRSAGRAHARTQAAAPTRTENAPR